MSFISNIRDPEFIKRLKELEFENVSYPLICNTLIDFFDNLNYSDLYFHCCEKNIVKLHREDARKKIDAKISEEAEISPVNQWEAWKPDFKYHNCCSNYDLTDEEKIYLWLINGNKEGLGLGLESLYSTTRVFLDESKGKELKDIDDRLGYYTKNNNEPQVWLLMDRITHAAKRLCCDRKYIIAKVYIHEMMHRFFDMRPDLPLKRYIKEIEEPMAEFATLKFIEELSKQRATFEKLLPIAIVMTEGLRKTKKYFIYALGVDLYYKAPIKLIYEFRRISMLLHRSREDCKLDGIELKPSPMKYVEDYVKLCKPNQDLQQLVGPIKECIETYAKFFSQDKGIQ